MWEVVAKQGYEVDNHDFESEKNKKYDFVPEKIQSVRFRTRSTWNIYNQYDFVPEKDTRSTISYRKKIQSVRFRTRDKQTPWLVNHTGRKTAGKQDTASQCDNQSTYCMTGLRSTRYQVECNDFESEKDGRSTISCQKYLQEVSTISYQKKTQETRFRTRDRPRPCIVVFTGRKTNGKQDTAWQSKLTNWSKTEWRTRPRRFRTKNTQ